jgi:hypothetical protein
MPTEATMPYKRQTASAEFFLVSNIAPIRLPDYEIKVSYLPYESKEQLAELRQRYFGKYIFRREEDNRVACVRLDGKGPKLGSDTTHVRLTDALSISVMLVRHALVNDYLNRGCEVTDYRPIEVISASSRQNLLSTVISQGVAVPDWISVRQLAEMDVRVVWTGIRPFIGLAVNLRIRKRITLSCSELSAAGVDLSNLFVAMRGKSDDPRISPPNRIVGRVKAISGNTLTLEDTREENDTIDAREVFLRVDSEAFERVLVSVFGERARNYADRLDTHLANLSQGKIRLDRIQAVLADLKQRKIEILPDAHVSFGSFLSEAEEIFPPVIRLDEPVFVFDPAGRKNDGNKPRGLDNFGPYTAQTFTPEQPRICVVCEAAKQGMVEQFVHKFLDGTNTAGLRYPPFKKGLCRGYHLKSASINFFVASSPSADAYRKAAQNALDTLSDGSRWDLALVQVNEATHHLRGESNPYLVSKAVFHSHQIPVQEFEEETMAMAAGNLEYALSNMALASYAKLGGIPWLMKADPTIAHEFVVGLGSSYIGSGGGYGKKERVVGITTIFSGDGNYFLSNLSRAVPMEQFKGALLEMLRTSFDQARTRMNWQKGDSVRLVFHSFKPMKDAEADSVMALAAELKDYAVEFAFLHVINNHPFLLFDTRQRGEVDFRMKAAKGEHVPMRGLHQPFSRSEALLTLTGPRELKRSEDGMPFSVLLRLHRNSTFVDLKYLARQVFHFSAHSWRSFLPASMPVTIVYSQLIARLLGNLSLIPHWSFDSVRGRLGRSRWFL